ncbi:hypothetical protein D3C80_1182070 [compost metagenome]
MPQCHHRLWQRNARAGVGQGCPCVAGEHVHLAGETLDALALQTECLDHPYTTDAFGQVLADLVVGGAYRSVKADQAIGLHDEQPQPGPGQQQWHQAEQRVVPTQQPHGRHHHQGCFDDLPPEGDQRITHLVGVAGGAGYQLTHAVAPVVAQVQALHLGQDTFTQARQQGLAEHQRQHRCRVLQQATAQRDGQQQPQPVPGHGGVQAAISQAHHGTAGADIVHGVADQPLLPDQAKVASDVQRGDKRKAPGHFTINGQGTKKRMVHEKARSKATRPL